MYIVSTQQLILNFIGDASIVSPKQPLLTNEHLRAEFAHLIVRISQILDSERDFESLRLCKDICHYWKSSALLTAESHTEIKEIKTFRQLFDSVCQYLRWDDYSLLSKCVDIYESNEAKEELRRYERKIKL